MSPMSQPSYPDVGIFKRKKEGFNSRLPIPSLFRRGHTTQSPSQHFPTPSYPIESSSDYLSNHRTRGQSVDLSRRPPQPKPARKSFDLDLRPRRFALSSKQSNLPSSCSQDQDQIQGLDYKPSTPSSQLPRKSLGDSPTSPSVLLAQRRNLKVRKPLPTFPESEGIHSELKSTGSIQSLQSSPSSSTSNSSTPTNRSDNMAIFPSFGANTNVHDLSSAELSGHLNTKNLRRRRSVSQSSLTRKFSEEAKRILGGNREKSREGSADAGPEGKALKRVSKTKDFDLRSHFINSASPTEESSLKDYEQFSNIDSTTVKSILKSPSKSSRPGSSDSTVSKSSMGSSSSSDLRFDLSSTSPIKARSRSRTTSSPTRFVPFGSSTKPPPRTSSRSSSRQTCHGIALTTSPIRTESGHGEESVSPSKANTSFESSLIVDPSLTPPPSPTKKGSGRSDLERPLLGSWLCEGDEEDEGNDSSLRIILQNHRRSSSECSLDVLDRRNLFLSSSPRYQTPLSTNKEGGDESKGPESNTFVFPLPPRSLRERHSHNSLGTSSSKARQTFRRNHSGGSSPISTFDSSLVSTSNSNGVKKDLTSKAVAIAAANPNSALRERRAKPPLTLRLPSSSFSGDQSKESRNRNVSESASPIWSPPPCPPPSTPLPELPNSSNPFKFDRHSRSSSGNPSPSSPNKNGILKQTFRARSRTFSSSNRNSRPLFSDWKVETPLNGVASNYTTSDPFSLDLNDPEPSPNQRKRVSFGLDDYSNMPSTSSTTGTTSSTSSRRDSTHSSDWASPLTPAFSLRGDPSSSSSSTSSPLSFQFRSLELVSRLNHQKSRNHEREIAVEMDLEDEVEVLKDEKIHLHCALGLEGLIASNLDHFNQLESPLHLAPELSHQVPSDQDDEIVYGFAI